MDDLSDVIMFQSNQMIAPNVLLESRQRHVIGNKRLASIEIQVDAVNLESRSLMKTQMRNGFNEIHDTSQCCFLVIGKMVSDIRYCTIKVAQEQMINFASTQNIARFARHAAIATHPLQIMWIVSMSLKLASIPRPKTLALGAKHLVATLSLVNKNLAIGARFCVLLQQ